MTHASGERDPPLPLPAWPDRPFVPGHRRRPQLRRDLLLAVVLFGVPAAFFLFRCSGTFFPLWNPRATLDARLTADIGVPLPASATARSAAVYSVRALADIGVPLPASATVTRGTWQAYIDPGEHYEIKMGPADAKALLTALGAGDPSPLSPSPLLGTAETGRPDWFRPETLAGLRRFDIEHRDRQGGFRWFYADGSGTIYLFWFRT